MNILREYYLDDARTPIYRCSSNISPTCGEIVSINNVDYEIIDSKYDYEVWQSTGIFVFSCRVKMHVVCPSITQKILNLFTDERTIDFNAIDFINGSYPGGDIGDYMHDEIFHYLAVARYKSFEESEIKLIEQESSTNKFSKCNFDIRFTGLDNSNFILNRSFFEATLYRPSIFSLSLTDEFKRDGYADILVQIRVKKNFSSDFEKFISDCMRYGME